MSQSTVSSPAPRIGVVSDGKAGHLNQSLGLADALQRLRPETTIEHFTAVTSWQAGISCLRGGLGEAAGISLLIAAGHRTHLTLLALRRGAACPAIVLMRPSIPRRFFDLCIQPRHDGGAESANLWLSDGPLNRMQATGHVGTRGLILLGGPSEHYHWNEAQLLSQLDRVCDGHSAWELSTSRRTPEGFLEALRGRQLPGLTIHSATDLPPGWLAQRLPGAPRCWVTPDSASMVYEALTAGCAVGLLDLQDVPGSRVANSVKQLGERGLVTNFKAFAQGQELVRPREPFAEADRCARRILDRGWL